MRHIVAYARDRGIRVVPEFDMPGHSTSWLLAYPEIGAGQEINALPQTFGVPEAELDPSNEKLYKMLDGLIGEMAAIFPDAYFHIGGDEVAGRGWLKNPKIKAFMDKKGFQKPADLQAYFNQRLLPILTKHGKKMMGWDEILNPALPKDIVVQSWRGQASLDKGAEEGYVGLLSHGYYLDAEQTSEQMFLVDPIPADTKLSAEAQKRILGGEACMWAEQINPETVDSRIWPRTLAIAERFWSQQSDRYIADMYRRLRITSLELEDVGITHISGPQKLLRNLAGRENPEALEVFASVLEPMSFHDRYKAQHPDRLTSLNQLVDAVVADPPSRQEIASEVDAAVGGGPAAKAARLDLTARFTAWQQAAPELQAMAATSPRLSDEAEQARQFGSLGTVGLESLAFLEAHAAPPSGWKEAQTALLDAAEKSSDPASGMASGLVKFDFLPALRRLMEEEAKGK